MPFVHQHAPQVTPTATDHVLAIRGDRLLARFGSGAEVMLPDLAALAGWACASQPPLHAGLLDGRACWLSPVDDSEAAAPAGWDWQETRALLPALTPAQWQAVGCARQLHWWGSRHRFCGCCGTPTVDAEDERAKRCPKCGASYFPSASPAVIVAVTNGDRLLLAHNRNFRPGMFSLPAGFVDPGETLEQAVVREVREEIGIEISDVRYVSSQPWPFPNSLMAGFSAVHRSGEIVVDGREIEQAGWFARDALPEIPRTGSVSRELIDAWRHGSA